MSKKEKTLEEALLQIKNIEDAMKQNAKGILESTMKQELKNLLSEEESEMTEEEGTEDMSKDGLNDLTNPKVEKVAKNVKGKNNENKRDGKLADLTNPKVVAEEDDESEEDVNENGELADQQNPQEVAEEEGNDEMGKNGLKGLTKPKTVKEQFDDEESDDEMGDEENNDDLEDELSDEDDSDVPDFGADDDMEDDDEVFDMTNASDDEVLKVFKAMGPEDGIVVKKDGEKIKVDTGEEEFIIDLGAVEDEEVAPEPEAEPEMDDEFGDEMDDEFGADDAEEPEAEPEMDDEFGDDEEELAEEDGVLEIDLDEGDCDDKLEECGEVAEEDVDEAQRTAAMGKPNANKGNPSPKRPGVNKKMFQAGTKGPVNENFKKQYQALKKQNTEYKKALGLFREKLNEVAVFNANLAYATRLFTEHSTTKQEKMNILERFDSVSTMNESKKTYVSLKKELDSKTSVTENVAEKITKSPSSSSSKEMLEENKVYENPQFKRMKDLMNKLK
jgi:hypothetical protein